MLLILGDDTKNAVLLRCDRLELNGCEKEGAGAC